MRIPVRKRILPRSETQVSFTKDRDGAPLLTVMKARKDSG
jgi:hypothetical protein